MNNNNSQYFRNKKSSKKYKNPSRKFQVEVVSISQQFDFVIFKITRGKFENYPPAITDGYRGQHYTQITLDQSREVVFKRGMIKKEMSKFTKASYRKGELVTNHNFKKFEYPWQFIRIKSISKIDEYRKITSVGHLIGDSLAEKGDSGSPLFDNQGKIIGMCVAMKDFTFGKIISTIDFNLIANFVPDIKIIPIEAVLAGTIEKCGVSFGILSCTYDKLAI